MLIINHRVILGAFDSIWHRNRGSGQPSINNL
jgi:hypothetical protein